MIDASALEVVTANVTNVDHGLVVVLRLRNNANRAIHYISDVRAIKYNPITLHLEVRLSDVGREVIPGAANVLPKFRAIDPDGEAELTLTLPEEIIMLAPPPDPELRQLAFQKHRIAGARLVELVLGWSDTPYYEDPRHSDDLVQPAARWQQFETRVFLQR